jgi:tellurite resistance protein
MPFDVRGKFQGVTWGGPDPTEQPRLVAELALWSAMSDGELEDREVEQIVATVKQVPGLEGFSVADAGRMLEEMVGSFDTEDEIAERIAQVALRITDPRLRRLSYQLAALCAASDGVFSDSEEGFLELLQEVFDIGDDEADGLVDELIAATD